MITKLFSNIRKAAAVITGLVLLSSGMTFPAAASGESYDSVYTGFSGASAVIKNLDYNDVKKSNTWARDAIYESGALGVLKGYGSKQFGLGKVLSKEEALALVFRAAGREADAGKAAETIDAARAQADKKKDTLGFWYDGFLKIAADDGLITRQQYLDSQADDQKSLDTAAFKRSAAVTRQEMAFWLAKALKLEPVYSQQEIFNGYNDWRQADPPKVPYIEAILKANIMNESDKGYFRPKQTVTREMTAQIVKNAEPLILTALGMQKKAGTIDDLTFLSSYSGGKAGKINTISITNSEGQLDAITFSRTGDGTLNEQDGAGNSGASLETVVYRKGSVGETNLLKTGDRVEYFIADDESVRYINVISNTSETRYIAAILDNINPDKKQLSVTQLMTVDYPDTSLIGSNADINRSAGRLQAVYNYSGNLPVIAGTRKADASVLTPDTSVILAINNSNVVTTVYMADFGINSEENNIVSGIVEDINPQLGYITLFSSNKVYPGIAGDAPVLKTFNYVNPNDIEIYKNHMPAGLSDIEPGDTAFLKLDDDRSVGSISAVDNYTQAFAKVISKRSSDLAVQYNDGSQQILELNTDVIVISEGILSEMDAIKDGDRVRMLVNSTVGDTVIKEITIEGSEHFITNIYKGTVSSIDTMSDKASIAGLQALESGKWVRTPRKGISSVKLADGCSYFYGSKQLDGGRLGNSITGSEAYIAVEKDYGGQEQAVVISFRNVQDSEISYNDSITAAVPGSGSFGASSVTGDINYDKGSIIVKNGRLVTGNSICDNDTACVVANRGFSSGELTAGIVQIIENTGAGSLEIYRGRISSINDCSDFTIESFSRLSGISWAYSNTPRTFRLSAQTRILGDDGIVGQRDFTTYGDESFKGRTVYIVAKDTDAVLISTAPYGSENFRGEIRSVTGSTLGQEGTLLTEPTGLKLCNVTYYDQSEGLWADNGDVTVKMPVNCIILKGGSAIKPSELVKGDIVRVIKKDDTAAGNAYIVMVE